MNIRLFCPVCTALAKENGIPAVIDFPMPIVEVNDSGVYEVVCQAKHTTRVALRNHKYEVLFELAVNAYVDGYYREAVSSFSSSMERFFEFFSKVVFENAAIERDDVSHGWKSVASQSERQLGVFIATHLLLAKRAPTLLSNADTQFRNDVIHKGKVPNKWDAAKFGDRVQEVIILGLDHLRNIALDALEKTYEMALPKVVENDKDDIVGGVNILTQVDALRPVHTGDSREGRVQDQIARIKRERAPHKLSLLTEAEMKERFPERFSSISQGSTDG